MASNTENNSICKLLEKEQNKIDAYDFSFLHDLTLEDFKQILIEYEKEKFDENFVTTPISYLYRYVSCVIEYFKELEAIEEIYKKCSEYQGNIQIIAFNYTLKLYSRDDNKIAKKTGYGYYKHYRKVINPKWRECISHDFYEKFVEDSNCYDKYKLRLFNIRDITDIPIEFQDDDASDTDDDNYTYKENIPSYKINSFDKFVDDYYFGKYCIAFTNRHLVYGVKFIKQHIKTLTIPNFLSEILNNLHF
jgi:hypothetical protein